MNDNYAELVFSRTKFAVASSAVPVILITGFRFGVGTDYFNTYVNGFYRFASGITVDNFEVGYRILLKTLISIDRTNPYLLIFITSVLFISFVYAAIYELSANIPFSILVFFISRYFFIGMNGVRQFIAMSIMLYALKFVIDGQIKKYLLLSVIAISFHYSVIIFIPVYFFCKIIVSRKLFLIIFGSGIAFSLIAKKVVMFLLANTKYYRLLDRYIPAGLTFTLFTIVINLTLVLIYYIPYKNNKNDKFYRLSLNMQIVATILTLTLHLIPQIERVYWIFSFPVILTLPYIISKIQNKKLRWLILTIVIIFMAGYCYYDIGSGDHDAIPYQWIFSN